MADVNIKINVVNQQAERALKGLDAQTRKTERGFKQMNLSIRNTTSAFKVFAGNVAAQAFSRLVGGVADLSKAFVTNAAEIETLTTQLEVLTGSAGQAAETMRQLQEFSSGTPFQLADITKATNQLLGFGFSADEAVEKLQGLGDVAAASGAPIRDISLIFGQVAAAGKLTGERLLQLQERAIPIGAAIADTLGVAESAVKDLVSEGKIDFATFEQAFRSLSEEGQFAFEGMTKASQTLEGRISTLKDNFNLISAEVGSALVPAIKAAVRFFTELIQTIQNSTAFKDFITDIAAGIPRAIEIFGNSINFVVNAVFEAEQALNTLRAVFNSVAKGIVDSVIAINQAEIAIKKFLGVDTSGIEEQNRQLKLLSETFEEVGTESLVANNKLAQSQVETTAIITEQTGKLIELYNEEAAAAENKANATVDANNKIVESDAATKEQQITAAAVFAQARRDAETENTEADLLAEQLKADASFSILEAQLGRVEAARITADARALAQEGKTAEASKKINEALVKAKSDQEKTEIANRRSTLGTIAGLQSSSNKTLAAIGKAAALTQIAIDGPQAVTKALAAFPPPFNFVAAAAVGAAVAAQAANVAGVKFQDGGIVPGSSFSGDQVQARVNSGEMILNRQQQAELFDMANGSGGGAGQIIQINNTIELDGEVVGKSVSRQVADGLVLGEVV